MNTFVQRLLLTVLGVPAFISLILFLPFYNYLAFFIVCILFLFQGIREFSTMLRQVQPSSKVPTAIISLTLPISAYIQVSFSLETSLFSIVMLTIIALILGFETITGYKDGYKQSIQRISGSLFKLFYPGFFGSYVFFLLRLPEERWFIALFFMSIFSTDVFAYVFGMLFGKNNRNIFKASPNKSLSGLIGGFLCALIFAAALWYIAAPLQSLLNLFQVLCIAALTSMASTLGDLVESVLKRASHIKDSGNTIPGRGGVLDSIDSIIFSAPFFFYLTSLLIG